MNRLTQLLIVTLASSALFACETKSADEYALHDIDMHMTVTSDINSFAHESSQGRSKVSAQLRPDDSVLTWLVLSGGDKLYANLNNAPGVNLHHNSLGGAVWYSNDLKNVSIGDEVSITLDRPGDDPATSYVTIPDTVWSLGLDKREFSRGTDHITLSWDLPTDIQRSDNLIVEVNGSCIHNFTQTVDVNSRSITFAPNRVASLISDYIFYSSDDDEFESCPLTFSVSVVRRGTASRKLSRSSSIEATTLNSIEVRSLP